MSQSHVEALRALRQVLVQLGFAPFQKTLSLRHMRWDEADRQFNVLPGRATGDTAASCIDTTRLFRVIVVRRVPQPAQDSLNDVIMDEERIDQALRAMTMASDVASEPRVSPSGEFVALTFDVTLDYQRPRPARPPA